MKTAILNCNSQVSADFNFHKELQLVGFVPFDAGACCTVKKRQFIVVRGIIPALAAEYPYCSLRDTRE